MIEKAYVIYIICLWYKKKLNLKHITTTTTTTSTTTTTTSTTTTLPGRRGVLQSDLEFVLIEVKWVTIPVTSSEVGHVVRMQVTWDESVEIVTDKYQ